MIWLAVKLFKVLDRAKSQLCDKIDSLYHEVHTCSCHQNFVINTSLLERASDAIEKASEMKSATVDDSVFWQSVLAELTQSNWP